MNPYSSLPSKSFWRPSVAEKCFLEIEGLWSPKFRIRPSHKVSTYGSCFAQHIGRALRERGFNWFLTEEAPKGLSQESAAEYNYGIFSSRTGNIYTTSLLLQWLQWAFGEAEAPAEIWEQAGRFYDPFRPAIEPGGFASKEELLRSRQEVLRSLRRSVSEADVFVFTLGLTERWLNQSHGYEYPMCPGTTAGTFDGAKHVFDNMDYKTVLTALRAAIAICRKANPKLQILLTVSPVPLTATASGKHVLVASSQSKSILRAVAGKLSDNQRCIDYFPSYEIITSPPFRGAFFEPNQRSVARQGVAFVMDSFFRDLEAAFGARGPAAGEKVRRDIKAAKPALKKKQSSQNIVCEEEILDAFGKEPR
ncbi:GSCFA domain-containing protein [Leisingera sp. D0M16]|uniref:GSCFA domain-containing protein n=1 Tax=Leisingera coralii TaxID=3351347 RepID=UPI003B7DF675